MKLTSKHKWQLHRLIDIKKDYEDIKNRLAKVTDLVCAPDFLTSRRYPMPMLRAIIAIELRKKDAGYTLERIGEVINKSHSNLIHIMRTAKWEIESTATNPVKIIYKEYLNLKREDERRDKELNGKMRSDEKTR